MWNIIQCAAQGRSHVKIGTPCQDKTYSVAIDDIYAIALADGAGSAKLSHYGAETVTKFICLELTHKFDSYFGENDGAAVKQQLVTGLIKVLSEKAKQLDCKIGDLASTLLFVAIKKEHFIIAHIGDGVIGYLKNNNLKIASYPENGEFANTTVFTTSKDALVTMKLIKGVLGQINGFVLMSDGTEASLYNKQQQRLADILKKIMQMSMIISSEKVQEQLQYSFESIITKATTDDCSIVMLTKMSDEFKGYAKLTQLQKCKLLKINRTTSKRLVRRYDRILTFLLREKSISQIAQYIHLKEKYTRKYIVKLCELNFVEKTANGYQTILIMDIVQEDTNTVATTIQ